MIQGLAACAPCEQAVVSHEMKHPSGNVFSITDMKYINTAGLKYEVQKKSRMLEYISWENRLISQGQYSVRKIPLNFSGFVFSLFRHSSRPNLLLNRNISVTCIADSCLPWAPNESWSGGEKRPVCPATHQKSQCSLKSAGSC